MTIGDVIDALKRIEALEIEKRAVIENREEYLDADAKLSELDSLIGLYRSEIIE